MILFAVFYFANGGVDFSRLTRGEHQMMLAVTVCLLGFVIQVIPPYSVSHHAVAGAALGLLGISAFYWVNFSHSGRIPGGPIFPLMFLPGMMEIFGQLIKRTQQKAQKALESKPEVP